MTYGDFKALLDRYLKRTDLRDLYDDWFLFTSLRIDKQLRLAEQEVVNVSVPTARLVSLPSDFIEMRSLATSAGGGTPIRFTTLRGIEIAANLQRFPTGVIRQYSIYDNNLELIPAPSDDSVAELTMVYYAKLPGTLTDQGTNAVLTAYPNLYLYGCMMEAAVFRMDQTDNQNYTQMWRDLAKELNDRAQSARFSGSPLDMRAP
jgi:hypothetical protein